MVITTQLSEGRHELQLQGRFDANWADHVGKAIESAIRGGQHEVDLDFSEVNYISSAGIRVLLKYYKQLKAARGSLRVLKPQPSVLSVLQLSGIAAMLVPAEQIPGASPAVESSKPIASTAAVRRWERAGVDFESHELANTGPLESCLRGRPEAFATGELQAAQSHHLRCDPDVLAVGLGAFG